MLILNVSNALKFYDCVTKHIIQNIQMSNFVKLCIIATISKLPPKESSVMAITVLGRV